MKLEIHGIEVFGFHGANEDERRDGQAFLVDVELEIPEPERDALDATIDYRLLRDTVRELSDERARFLIETLAAELASALFERFGAPVTVRVRKPGVAWAEWTAATSSAPRP